MRFSAIVFSESLHVVHYVVLRDGSAVNSQLIRVLDDQQLMTALTRANTTRRYSAYLFTGSVRGLMTYRRLLKLAFLRAVASSSYADIQSIVQRFYRNRYPGT